MLWYIIGELAINAIYVNTRMVLDIVKVLKYTYSSFFKKILFITTVFNKNMCIVLKVYIYNFLRGLHGNYNLHMN